MAAGLATDHAHPALVAANRLRGGLSGVLHAGALLLAVHLLFKLMAMRKARCWGVLLALAVLARLVLEQGWSHPVVWSPGNEMSVVQAAHLTGSAWGLVLGLGLATVWLGRGWRSGLAVGAGGWG